MKVARVEATQRVQAENTHAPVNVFDRHIRLDVAAELNTHQDTTLYEELERLLKLQLRSRPEDTGAQIRIMELYFETRRPVDFLRIAKAFAATHNRSEHPAAWATVVKMGRRLLPDEQMFMTMAEGIDYEDQSLPDLNDYSGRFGDDPKCATYFEALDAAYQKLKSSKAIVKELDAELICTLNRPSSLTHLAQLSKKLGGAQIYLKREDLSPQHTHLGISVTAQAMLAKKLNMKHLVTASVKGQRGLMVASIARHLGMKALVFTDRELIDQQGSTMRLLELMGAEVQPVDLSILSSGDLREVALEYCVRSPGESFLVMGLDGAPRPYPQIVMDSVSVIGRETMMQVHRRAQCMPDLLVARAGDNADAIGFFSPFLPVRSTKLACVEPLPDLIESLIANGRKSVSGLYPLHKEIDRMQRSAANRVLDGLDYPSVKREQGWLRESGRVDYPEVTPTQVRQAVRDMSHMEGMIPALETAHALAHACEAARGMEPENNIVVLVAEHMEKDLFQLDSLMFGDLH